MVARLLSRIRQLEVVRLSDRRVSDYPDDELWELPEKPYRIIYRVNKQQIEILAVMHYRQLLPATVAELCLVHNA